ncbi:MAG: DUF4351 domain-containing protein [Candidatus Sericytochromatia bacterium]|nr:DUF4351 domain-containing protein [Candidatus Sericytochromatia bacterium]
MAPSPLHEVLIELLRQVPDQLAPALARVVPGLDPTLPVTFVDASASEPVVVERRADLVMLIGETARPRLIVIVEIQLGRDNDKHYSWPQYVVAMRQRWRCEVALLVIAPDPEVAAWARKPIRLDWRGSQVVPLVLGSGDFPRISLADLAGHPHATVFHALLHCRDRGDLPLLEQALNDIKALPDPDRVGYYEVLRRCLSPSFLGLAEVAMSLEHTRFYQELVARLRAEGEALGEARGEARGEAKGEAKGELQGRRSQALRAISLLSGRRFGLPGPEALAKMEVLPLETLEQLLEDLLDFTGPEDLEAWLARH